MNAFPDRNCICNIMIAFMFVLSTTQISKSELKIWRYSKQLKNTSHKITSHYKVVSIHDFTSFTKMYAALVFLLRRAPQNSVRVSVLNNVNSTFSSKFYHVRSECVLSTRDKSSARDGELRENCSELRRYLLRVRMTCGALAPRRCILHTRPPPNFFRLDSCSLLYFQAFTYYISEFSMLVLVCTICNIGRLNELN